MNIALPLSSTPTSNGTCTPGFEATSNSRRIERAPDLRSQVYDHLRASIVAGDFGVRVRLAEQAVADTYGVSRTPAREALAMLVRDGLLVQDGRGFIVPDHTIEDIIEVFELRLSLEPQAMHRLASIITCEQIEVVRELSKTISASDLDPVSYADRLRGARATLFAMAGNRHLQKAVEFYDDHVTYVAQRTLIEGTWQDHSCARMRELLDGLMQRDPPAAARAMSAVLIAARDAIIATLKHAG